MVSVNSAGNSAYIERPASAGNKPENTVTAPENNPGSGNIETTDVNTTRTYRHGSSPASVNFAEPQKAERLYNPLVTLLATFLLVGSSLANGAYNEELFEAAKEDLGETAKFLSQHGLAYDMSLTGVATPKETSELYTREDKYPHASK